MSLINRMLKDLSSREPAPRDVMRGIQIPHPDAARTPARGGRWVLMLGLVVAFTAGLFWLLEPRAPAPLPAGPQMAAVVTPAAAAAAAATAAPAPATTPTPVPEPAADAVPPENLEPPRLRLDTELSNSAEPSPAQSLYAQAITAQQRGDLKQAEQKLTAALELNPNLHAARELLVGLRLDQYRTADARRSLERGLGFAPRYIPFQRLAQRLESQESSARAVTKPAPAPVVVAETAPPAAAPASSPISTPAVSGISKHVPAPAAAPATDDHAAREAQALRLIAAGRLTEAAEIVSQGLEREPSWSGYRRLAARIELARNQPKAALAMLETDPPPLALDPEYHGLLASAYQRLSRHQDAARVYQSLTKSQPGEAHWWAGYAISQDSLGESVEALKAYAQARKLGQLDARVLEYIDRRVAALRDDE